MTQLLFIQSLLYLFLVSLQINLELYNQKKQFLNLRLILATVLFQDIFELHALSRHPNNNFYLIQNQKMSWYSVNNRGHFIYPNFQVSS